MSFLLSNQQRQSTEGTLPRFQPEINVFRVSHLITSHRQRYEALWSACLSVCLSASTSAHDCSARWPCDALRTSCAWRQLAHWPRSHVTTMANLRFSAVLRWLNHCQSVIIWCRVIKDGRALIGVKREWDAVRWVMTRWVSGLRRWWRVQVRRWSRWRQVRPGKCSSSCSQATQHEQHSTRHFNEPPRKKWRPSCIRHTIGIPYGRYAANIYTSHRSLRFLLQDWLHGFPGLFTDTFDHNLFLNFLVFLFAHFLVVGSDRLRYGGKDLHTRQVLSLERKSEGKQ